MTFIKDTEPFFGSREGDTTELLRDRIEHDVGLGIRFLLKAQQKDNKNNMRGAVPGKYTGQHPANLNVNLKESNLGHAADVDADADADAASEDEEDSEDDEDYDISEVRVDYVQHSMSAVMAYESFLLKKKNQKEEGKRFRDKVNEKVHRVADKVKHKIDNVTRSSTFVNLVLLCIVVFLVLVVICIAYSLPLSSFSRRKHRRRRVKRQD